MSALQQEPDGIYSEYGKHPSHVMPRNTFARETRELGWGSGEMRTLFNRIKHKLHEFSNGDMSEAEHNDALNQAEIAMKPLFVAVMLFAAGVVLAQVFAA